MRGVLRRNEVNMYNIGIDVGGTNLAAGIVDEKLHLTAVKSRKTDREADTEGLVRAMTELACDLLAESGISSSKVHSLGLGVPGTANRETGYLEYANNLPNCVGNLCRGLEESLGKKVYFDNDANAAAWGEYLACDNPPDSFLMVTLGTGIGGGIILNRKLWRGINYAAGEMGHMTIRYDGEMCSCGRRGCLEMYASGEALIRQGRRSMEKNRDSILWKLCEGALPCLNGKIICEGARRKDAASMQVMEEYTAYLGEGLVDMINIFQPEVLCIGGGVGNSPDILMPLLEKYVAPRIYSRDSARNTQLKPAVLGNDAGIIGAAMLYACEE